VLIVAVVFIVALSGLERVISLPVPVTTLKSLVGFIDISPLPIISNVVVSCVRVAF